MNALLRVLRVPLYVWHFLVAGALLPAAAFAGSNSPTELRVSRIALFSSGVGYFERDASVSDDATAELKFRTEQINDILKSMVVQDFGGGRIGSVGYASRDPVEKALRSFGVDIAGKPTLAQLLDQLRGEPIEISGPRATKGTILGVEKQQLIVGEKNVVNIDLLNVLTEKGMEQLRLNELQGIKLTSERVDAELRKALGTLATSHDADKKTVVIEFEGKGQRKVRAAYLLEAPIWKTSYRLVLAPDKKPFIQGWATVENATEEDWKDVKLSLVSGRPISFRMDLYTPLYVPRPMEQLEIYASLRPPEYAAGYEGRKAEKDRDAAGQERGQAFAKNIAPPPPSAATAAPAMRRAAGRFDDKAKMTAGEDAEVARLGVELQEAGVASVAETQEAGELFEYVISTPVSIGRQHSAMLPIVNEEVKAEKVSIYNPASHPKHPLNGLMLTNSTKLNLMQGPVTVFDENVYAGDAKLPDLRPDEKRLVAYALDLGTEVMIDTKSHPEQLVSLRLSKGTLWHKRKYVDERMYQIKNKTEKPRDVLIEQPYDKNWTLIEPKEPTERTESLLRFKVAAAASKTTPLTVRLEWTADQQVAIGNMDFDTIQYYIRSSVISKEVKAALERVIALRTELDQATRRRADVEKQLNETVQEQARIRENVKTLDKTTDAYQRQLKKFDELETQIEKFKAQLAEARKDEEQKRAALEAYLLSLEVG